MGAQLAPAAVASRGNPKASSRRRSRCARQTRILRAVPSARCTQRRRRWSRWPRNREVSTAFAFYQNIRGDTYLDGRRRKPIWRRSQYRGFRLQRDRMDHGGGSGRRILPEMGFSKNRHAAQLCRRVSRAARIPTCGSSLTQASINYRRTIRTGWTRARSSAITKRAGHTDVAGSCNGHSIVRWSIDVATGAASCRRIRLTHAETLYTGGQSERSQARYLEQVRITGHQKSISVSAARRKSRPDVARTERVVTSRCLRRPSSMSFAPANVHLHPAHVRQRHRPVQLATNEGSNLR